MKLSRIVPPAALVAALVSGCAGGGGLTRPSDPLQALQFDIDQILADSIFVPAKTSIKVISLENGQNLYERDSKLLMRPASNMKLLTSTAALHILGPDYRFKTSIFADSIDPIGTVRSNVYFKGEGNPDLRSTDLDTIVFQMKSAGVRKVAGDVVADASLFDDLPWGEGWMWDDEPFSYEAAISALSINKNCVKVTVIPGQNPGDPVQVSLDPQTDYVSLLNIARSVPDTALEPLVISRLFKDRSNTIVVKGEVVAGEDTLDDYVAVWRPELYAAQLLKERLARDGITVGGVPTAGITPQTAHEIASLEWPIDTMLINLNKESDNLSAELTLKTISVKTGAMPGTARHGLYQVNHVLSSFGIDTTKYYVVDGSGVSHYNLVTAEMLIQLLQSLAHRTDLFPLFYKSLPIAGVDGTMKGRMKGTEAEGNLRAKTGSIGGVSSLSGYVTTLDGERLAFSVLMQNFIWPTRLYRNAQDKIGAILAGFSRRPAPFAGR